MITRHETFDDGTDAVFVTNAGETECRMNENGIQIWCEDRLICQVEGATTIVHSNELIDTGEL